MIEDNRRIFKFYGKTGENYQLWAARTQAAICAKEVGNKIKANLLSGGPVDDDQRNEIATACAIIIQGLGEKPLRLCLADQNDPYRMWHRL